MHLEQVHLFCYIPLTSLLSAFAFQSLLGLVYIIIYNIL
jgi:hypothetical protein